MGARLETAQNGAPVPFTLGWQYTVTKAGEVILSETEQYERIIALEYSEYQKLEGSRRDAGTVNRVRNVNA